MTLCLLLQELGITDGITTTTVETTLVQGHCVAKPRRTFHRPRSSRYHLDLTTFKHTLPPLQERVELGVLCEALGLKVGLEIGVQRAEFTRELLRKWQSFEKMYLLDPWEQQVNYADIANKNNAQQEKIYREANKNVAPFQNAAKNKVELIRGYSNTKANLFNERSLDFIYIDARHDYCGVYEDISLYWPKLSCGGIMAGHDYLSADEVNFLTKKQNWSLCANGTIHLGAVRTAVNEFADRHRVQVMITYRERFHFNSWYMRKVCDLSAS